MIDESKRDIGMEILEGIRAIKRGEGRRFMVEVPPIVAARQKTGMSQSQFAELLGVSIRTLREWEQGRKKYDNDRPKYRKIYVLAQETTVNYPD